MAIEKDDACGGVMEDVGTLLRYLNLEDSSGYRRLIHQKALAGDKEGMFRALGLESKYGVANVMHMIAGHIISEARQIPLIASIPVGVVRIKDLEGSERELEVRQLETGELVGLDGAYLDALDGSPEKDFPVNPYSPGTGLLIPDDEKVKVPQLLAVQRVWGDQTEDAVQELVHEHGSVAVRDALDKVTS